jgi:hypothetical protein
MDKKQVIVWVGAAVARGIAWALAAKLGYDATTAQSTAAGITDALIALTLAGISIYSSYRGRKALLNTLPPK